ncbi:DsrE family protein [Halodesulfurarchaeum sp.]|uniref:DsrE family protein n=1 Tax=Halodesulfurarchaeum sp. TaxID=1980530 RepID=UPI001BBE48F8|nr:DsrE family protein [Halodesulfurarchaeum sp.]
MKKSVAVILTRAPYGRIHLSEGLRAAGGIAAGFDHHDVTVIFAEDAVYAAREDVDREALNMPAQITDLKANDGTMLVDRSAMEVRNIDSQEIMDDTVIVSASEVTESIQDAEEVLTF